MKNTKGGGRTPPLYVNFFCWVFDKSQFSDSSFTEPPEVHSCSKIATLFPTSGCSVGAYRDVPIKNAGVGASLSLQSQLITRRTWERFCYGNLNIILSYLHKWCPFLGVCNMVLCIIKKSNFCAPSLYETVLNSHKTPQDLKPALLWTNTTSSQCNS